MASGALQVSFAVNISNRAVVVGDVRAVEIVEEAAQAAEASGLFDSIWGVRSFSGQEILKNKF